MDNTGLLKKNTRNKRLIIDDITFQPASNRLSFQLKEQIQKNSKLVIAGRRNKIEWIEQINVNPKLNTVTIDLSSFIDTYYNQNSRWDLYIESDNITDGSKERKRIGAYDKEVEIKYKRYFDPAMTVDSNVIAPYLTEQNGLSIVVTPYNYFLAEKSDIRINLVEFDMKKNIIKGKIKVVNPIGEALHIHSFILKFRSKADNIEYDYPIHRKKINNQEEFVFFEIDIADIKMEKYYWDFYLNVSHRNENFLARLRNPSITVKSKVRKFKKNQHFDFSDGFWVYPYLTAANTVALIYKEKEVHDSDIFKWKELFAYTIATLFKWYFDRKNIWLCFEKFSDSAQDNSYYFFKYCYENTERKNLYYVIKETSPDYSNVKNMEDKVIHYMSFKYLVYLFAAKLLISSESKMHVYDIRAQKGRIKKFVASKKHVFLQHGVIALKRVDSIYKKTSKNAVDLFVVSSESEKNIIKNNFGYLDEEVIVTGLSRWDVLVDKTKQMEQSNLLLMPTWRSWMDDLPEEKFIETDYYKNYIALLNSKELAGMLEQYNIALNFFIHPKFKAYIDKFSSNNERVRIYQYGEIRVNELLMESTMLITDYSSVAWDMYYQKKPILFYQFDLEDYMKYQGSYIDMDSELFGDRAFTTSELIELIKKYAGNGFMEDEKFASMRAKLLKYTDKNNSKRIYHEIINNKPLLKKNKRKYSLKNSLILQALWSFSKRNKAVFRIAVYLRDKVLP